MFTPTCSPNYCTDNASYFFPAGPGIPLINPRFTTINAHRWDGNSYYHSFQANLTRRFANGLQYQGSYTWSRNLDTAASFRCCLAERRRASEPLQYARRKGFVTDRSAAPIQQQCHL